MTPDMLRRIFAEAGPDFSAETCPGASLADLDPAAIDQFRERWLRTSGIQALANRPVERLLRDAELLVDAGFTYAALILLGTRQALGRHLAQAEVVFEYRSTPRPGPANQREEFRQGFLLFYDRLWDLVNLRNDQQHFQHGMVMHPVPTFSETSVREAVLNAVGHRDYRHPGSVFVRQFSRRIEIVSPGGFPPGITAENILDQQLPRNRRIAETFARCGLVERSGQGADRMLEECVRNGKPFPDFSRTDDHQVWLTLDGEIKYEGFLRFVESIGQERLASLDAHDFLILGLLVRGKAVPAGLRDRLSQLLDLGILERIARGKVVLSHRFYPATGVRAAATQKRDIARERNKADLFKLIAGNQGTGVAMEAMLAAMPSLNRSSVKRVLDALRREGRVHPVGTKRNVRWYPGPAPGFGSGSLAEGSE